MYRRPPPIGFEGILEKEDLPCVGFENFENGGSSASQLSYPTINTMPMPHPIVHEDPTHLYDLEAKKLSSSELASIYHEITDIWFHENWLTYADHHQQVFLTLRSPINQWATVQSAIDRHFLTIPDESVLFEPEILLVRTENTCTTIFQPNDKLNLTKILSRSAIERFSSYKLMSMITHSDETNSKLFLHNHFPTNSWYLYYDQSSSTNRSNRLSTAEENQLNLFITKSNRINPTQPSDFPLYPFSSLYNHPIIFVYVIDKEE